MFRTGTILFQLFSILSWLNPPRIQNYRYEGCLYTSSEIASFCIWWDNACKTPWTILDNQFSVNGSSSYLSRFYWENIVIFSFQSVSHPGSVLALARSKQKKLGLATLSGENFTRSWFSPNTCSLLFPVDTQGSLGNVKPGYRAEDFGEELSCVTREGSLGPMAWWFV